LQADDSSTEEEKLLKKCFPWMASFIMFCILIPCIFLRPNITWYSYYTFTAVHDRSIALRGAQLTWILILPLWFIR
jgi:hypothetical protein